MKKLNKKGFTLIELLAVIVILAIIVVVTVPTILNSINDARLSSIHSLSKEVANWYDTSSAQDMIALDPTTTILKGANTNVNDQWKCLGSVMATADGYTDKSLADLYGLSLNDLVLTGTPPTPNTFYPIGNSDVGGVGNSTDFDSMCSAIKVVDGRALVVLIATRNGKFNTNGDLKTYAASFGPKAYDNEF